jgi:hypothetical protein
MGGGDGTAVGRVKRGESRNIFEDARKSPE